MFQKITALMAIALFATGSVLAQDTGGDKKHQRTSLSKSHKASNTAQPPDPLIVHKSPGQNRPLRRHRRTPDALVVKQKSTSPRQ